MHWFDSRELSLDRKKYIEMMLVGTPPPGLVHLCRQTSQSVTS
jgi:hypothetical protein